MADNIIFLDFDGVMHPVGSCVWNADKQQMQAEGAFRWWPILEKALEGSTDTVYLVVHSTWRLMWETDEELFAMLPPSMVPYVLGTTDRACMGRERSILDYVAKHEVANFVVLDDEPQAFPEGYTRLIACNSQQGLSQASVFEALSETLAQWSLRSARMGTWTPPKRTPTAKPQFKR